LRQVVVHQLDIQISLATALQKQFINIARKQVETSRPGIVMCISINDVVVEKLLNQRYIYKTVAASADAYRIMLQKDCSQIMTHHLP
jgi:tRNA pseudouridine-54 N-methylase